MVCLRNIYINTLHKGDDDDDDGNNNDNDDDDVQRPGDWGQQNVVRTKIVPVITGALGTIKKGLVQNL